MKYTLMILAVLVVSTGFGIAWADAEHPEQTNGNGADPSGSTCSVQQVDKAKPYKVHSNSKPDTTPKQNEQYTFDIYGDVWVLSASQKGNEPPPDFYARGKVHFDEKCEVTYLIGKAFIDGHGEHTLFLIPRNNWNDLIGQIVSPGSHMHEQQQAGAAGDSIILVPFTHNGQVHWGP